MVGSGPESGGTPVGGSRRPSRRPRSSLPAGFDSVPESDAQETWPHGGPTPAEENAAVACPWLYLAADPDGRVGFVTAEHRCEIRPDEIPGPGHQLAYCLGSNHISCPQLRNYEAQRHAAAASARARQGAAAPRAGELAAAAVAKPSIEGFGRPFGIARGRGSAMTRFAWAAAGAVGALVVVAGLALYSTPETLIPDDSSEASVGTGIDVPSSPDSAQLIAPSAGATVGPSGEPGAEASSVSLPELAAGATKPATYTVQPGDTLGKIARGLDVSLVALLAANDISADAVVRVGDQLFVPATAGPPPEGAQPTGDSPED